MKRFLTNMIATVVLALVFVQFLPWWSVMLAAFLAGAIVRLRKAAVFFAPFLAITLFWSISAWLISSPNDFIMAKKVAVLLPLNGNTLLLVLITGIVGGLASGIAGVFGNQCRQTFSKSTHG